MPASQVYAVCDEGRTNNRVLTGRATGIIHLLLAVLLFAPICAAGGTAQSSTFLWGQNASDSVSIYATPTVMAIETPSYTALSGTVLDGHGNKVPGAFVLLYMEGGTAPIRDNPTYSGSDAENGYGEYHFSGIRPGNYTVYVEKSDIFLYNGSASIVLTDGIDTRLNVILKGYTAKPQAVQTFDVVAAPVVTDLPRMSSTTNATDDVFGEAKDKLLVPLIGLFIIAIGGAGVMTLRDFLKPKNKGKAVSLKPAISGTKPVFAGITATAAASTMKDKTGYTAEIEDLAKAVASSGYGDLATLNRINSLSKKYGVDQNTIFSDIKKAKGGKR